MSTAVEPARITTKPQVRFARFGWAVLAYNIPVILWGAYVRASYSGDGCGANWPFCQGQIIPRGMKLPTLIEFAHRMTTGLDTVLVVVLCVWAFRAFPEEHDARRYAVLSLVFLLIEALLGAGLVLFRFVAKDQSAGRAWYLSAHLVNTLLMLAAMTATAWAAKGEMHKLRLRAIPRVVWIALGATMLMGITGAIAALGDTLFPASSLASGFAQDLSSGSPALLRLRLFHPVIAGSGALYVLWAASRIKTLPARMVVVATLLQVTAGMVNLSLRAPIPMQLIHLLLGDLMWIALVVTALQSANQSQRAAYLTS